MGHKRWLGHSCHYCGNGEVELTTDHIVARALLHRAGLMDLPVVNIVPSCAPCNAAKGHRRPTCECEVCVTALESFLELTGLRQITSLGLRRGLSYKLGERLSEERLARIAFQGLDSGSAYLTESGQSQTAVNE